MSDAKLSPHQQALLPYKYSIAETPLGNWIVTSSQMERPLCHFPDKQTAFSVAFTLNAEYGDVYDKGWERGYDVGQEVATDVSASGYQPSGLVALNDPPGDE